MSAKRILRRLALGLGAALLIAGIGTFLGGHEALHVIISFGNDDPAQREKILGAFKGGTFLAALGAALLGFALPAPSVPAPTPPGQ